MKLALAALLGVLAGPAAALPCRLALTLALDVSSSVDAGEYALQAEGLARALEDPDVAAAAFAVPGTVVALQAFEWSGTWQSREIFGWTQVTGPADLSALAARVRASGRSTAEYPTALGHALVYAAARLAEAPPCDRQVIDVSGDGPNNDGYPPRISYRDPAFARVTVNALAVGGDPGLVTYFQRSVIRGPGAFVEVANDYADYARAIRRKLLRELLPLEVSHDR